MFQGFRFEGQVIFENSISIKSWLLKSKSLFYIDIHFVLSKKEIKIVEYGLKTCPSARLGSRKLKKGVQNASKHESAISTQKYHSTLLECQSTLSKCRIALFWVLAQLTSGADKAHPFRLFRRKTYLDSHSTHRWLFFKHSSLYKQRLDLKILDTFYALRGTFFYTLEEKLFHTLKFLTPFLVFSLKLGFLGFKDNCINCFEP